MGTTKPRFTMTVDEDLLKEIEEYRYSHHIPTRTEAIMELMKIGVQALKEQVKEQENDQE